MIVCTAPGKIMLAGEYAVIDGSNAVMLAIDRLAVATIHPQPQRLSPFLAAVHSNLAEQFGDESPQAQAAMRVRVDTSAFREKGQKLGLGSSAAATVAAVGVAMSEVFDVERVHEVARRAHGDAQEPKGTRGSGADVASCCLGSCLRFSIAQAPAKVTLPNDLHLVFPWCGQPASTTSLVSQVRSLKIRNPGEYERLCRVIATSADDLASAIDAAAAIDAVDTAGNAVAELGRAAGAELWLPVHSQMRDIAQQLGGSVKPTGAGGGDLALGAFPSSEQATQFALRLTDHGIDCPTLAPTREGVRLQSRPSKVSE